MQANFSSHAQRALENAQETAGEMGHRYIGSEHLLLGLILTEDSAAGELLHQAGVSFEGAKEKLSKLCEVGEPIQTDTAEITPRAQRILQTAVYESAKQHSETGTEFILLALLSDGDSLGVRILNLLGVDMHGLYRSVREYVREKNHWNEKEDGGAKGQGKKRRKTEKPV